MLASPSLLQDYRQEWKHSLGNKNNEIVGKWDVLGFSLKPSNELSFLEDCQNLKRVKFLILTAIHIRGNEGRVPEALIDCNRNHKLPALDAMINILSLKEKRISAFSYQFKKSLSKFKFRKEIEKVLELKQRQFLKKTIPLSYWEEYYKKENIDSNDDLEMDRLIKQTNLEFQKVLLKILFALKKKRKGILESELKVLLKKPFFEGLFSQNYYREDYRTHKAAIEKLTVTVFDEIESIDLKIMFFIYLDEFYPEVTEKLLSKKMKFSLEKYNGLVNSPYWGLEFPQVILPSLERRAQKSDVSNYIFKFKDYKINSNNVKNYTFLSLYNFLEDKKIRNLVSHEIERMYFSENKNDKFLSLELLTSSSIKREMKKKNQEFVRPIFILKRQFYLDILNKNIATDFAIFNLVSLGDIRTSYLWWLIL